MLPPSLLHLPPSSPPPPFSPRPSHPSSLSSFLFRDQKNMRSTARKSILCPPPWSVGLLWPASLPLDALETPAELGRPLKRWDLRSCVFVSLVKKYYIVAIVGTQGRFPGLSFGSIVTIVILKLILLEYCERIVLGSAVQHSESGHGIFRRECWNGLCTYSSSYIPLICL